MSWTEFQILTLAQLEALEERRMIAIRYARFNSALLTSVFYNAHRASDSRPISPFDFIPGFEADVNEEARKTKRKHIKDNVRIAFAESNCQTPEEAKDLKARLLARMVASGVEDAEDIFRECFPSL